MSLVYKRDIPLIVTFACGITMIVDWQFKIAIAASGVTFLRNCQITLVGWASILAAVNLYRRFGGRLSRTMRRKEYKVDMFLDIWLLTLLSAFIFSGVVLGGKSPEFRWLYDKVYFPVTLAASALWYITPACYRFLRAKSVETTLITISGFLGLMSVTPLMMVLTPWAVTIQEWINVNVSATVYRGLWICVGLGTIGVGIRTLIGIETGWLGARLEEEVAA